MAKEKSWLNALLVAKAERAKAEAEFAEADARVRRLGDLPVATTEADLRAENKELKAEVLALKEDVKAQRQMLRAAKWERAGV